MLAQLHSTDNGAMDYIYVLHTYTYKGQDERLRYFYSVS